MSTLRWPIVTLVVRAHLRTHLNDIHVTGRRGVRDVKVSMPFLIVTRGPGGDDGVTDSPLVDIEHFAADEDAMWRLAEDVRDAMHQLAGTTAAGALVDTVRTSTGASEVPYAKDVFRAIATYRLQLRKQPAT